MTFLTAATIIGGPSVVTIVVAIVLLAVGASRRAWIVFHSIALGASLVAVPLSLPVVFAIIDVRDGATESTAEGIVFNIVAAALLVGVSSLMGLLTALRRPKRRQSPGVSDGVSSGATMMMAAPTRQTTDPM